MSGFLSRGGFIGIQSLSVTRGLGPTVSIIPPTPPGNIGEIDTSILVIRDTINSSVTRLGPIINSGVKKV